MFMNKLLIIKCDSLLFKMTIHIQSEIVENPVPILWVYKGAYYWIPIEIIKNKINEYLDKNKMCPINHPLGLLSRLELSLQQAYRLQPDVGKMLESLTQSNNQSDNCPKSNSPS